MNKSKQSKSITPVLFLVFNRMSTTRKVFAEIKKAKPSKLFIASDGPRKNKPGEEKIVKEIRTYLLKNINWKCEVKTLFGKENLGCKGATIKSINWFFENVAYGIILEDDCLPSQDLFKFSGELLERYKDNDKIKAVCGTNFLGEYPVKESYLFSRIFFSSWGFATWKRAWKMDEKRIVKALENRKKISPYFIHDFIMKKKLHDVMDGRSQGWDYIFVTNNLYLDDGLALIPSKNLVESLGFEEGSTHKTNSTDKKYLDIQRRKIFFPLKHPTTISANKNFDKKMIWWAIKIVLEKKIRKLLFL